MPPILDRRGGDPESGAIPLPPYSPMAPLPPAGSYQKPRSPFPDTCRSYMNHLHAPGAPEGGGAARTTPPIPREGLRLLMIPGVT